MMSHQNPEVKNVLCKIIIKTRLWVIELGRVKICWSTLEIRWSRGEIRWSRVEIRERHNMNSVITTTNLFSLEVALRFIFPLKKRLSLNRLFSCYVNKKICLHFENCLVLTTNSFQLLNFFPEMVLRDYLLFSL